MQSLLQVDDELDAEELHHPELHHTEKWAGASSLQRHGSSSSELASSEQGQDTPSNGWGPDPSSSEQGQDTPSNGWGSEPSSNEQGQDTTHQHMCQKQGNFGYDNELGPSGFPAGPQGDGWGPEPSNSKAASEQEEEEDPSMAVQHRQQRQNVYPTRRGGRGGDVARM
jgi:hypothetical protein